MANLNQIQTELDSTQRRLDEMPDRRSKILSELFKARDENDSKTAVRAKSELQDHDVEMEALRQKSAELSESLKRRVRESISEEIRAIPELERSLHDEALALGKEIGEALGKAEFLQTQLFGSARFLDWYRYRGPDGKRNRPPEGMDRVFKVIDDQFRATMDRLAQSDPQAASFHERRSRLGTLKQCQKDVPTREHLVLKKLAILARDAKQLGG